jgi:competence ComEA-like helix-hairpin-helix protein
MFNLTLQERKVVLFLVSVALAGVGISFAVKVNAPVARAFQVDSHLTKIDLNRAELEDLSGLPGITPKLADKILAYRNSAGAFKDIEELKEIRGIGDYRYEKLKNLFFVQ